MKNALKLDNVNWANAFIREYKDQLNPEMRNDIASYCTALLAFHDRKIEQANDILCGLNFSEDFAYHLEFRVLLIKTYYERCCLNEIDLESHLINYELEAMRQHVSTRNKKLAEPLRQAYNNFVNGFKRILERKKKLQAKQIINSTQLNKLREELSTLSPLVERDWLMEKVEGLVEEG